MYSVSSLFMRHFLSLLSVEVKSYKKKRAISPSSPVISLDFINRQRSSTSKACMHLHVPLSRGDTWQLETAERRERDSLPYTTLSLISRKHLLSTDLSSEEERAERRELELEMFLSS